MKKGNSIKLKIAVIISIIITIFWLFFQKAFQLKISLNYL